tara:strand:+ start:5059 stop:5535 length:477 start_codon:yes stop_codon:yes gene_type:complete
MKDSFFIPILFLIAFIFSIIPLPDYLQIIMPEWIALLLFFFSLMNPERVGLFLALVLGIILDLFSGSLLGQHALSLLLPVAICLRLNLIVRVFPIWQLNVFIVIMLIIYEFILFWIDGVLSINIPISERIFPIISSVLVWPIILRYLPKLRDDISNRI